MKKTIFQTMFFNPDFLKEGIKDIKIVVFKSVEKKLFQRLDFQEFKVMNHKSRVSVDPNDSDFDYEATLMHRILDQMFNGGYFFVPAFGNSELYIDPENLKNLTGLDSFEELDPMIKGISLKWERIFEFRLEKRSHPQIGTKSKEVKSISYQYFLIAKAL